MLEANRAELHHVVPDFGLNRLAAQVVGVGVSHYNRGVTIEATIQGVHLEFETGPSLFSPKAVDQGSSLLLSLVRFESTDRILDLGCGYGAMGIYAARLIGPGNVYMTDNDPEALRFAAKNVQINKVDGVHLQYSDGFTDLRATGFTKILCNPPYHTDFSVAKHFIEKGFNRLAIGGAIWMVTKRDTWYRNKLAQVFGGVRVVSQDSYFEFQASKKSASYAHRGSPQG